MAIPPTKHGLNRMTCISALQKEIRRGNTKDACGWAFEVARTDRAGFSYVCNRLLIIAMEDIGDATVIVAAKTCIDIARDFYKPDFDPGKWYMPIATAIRFMCESPKTRIIDDLICVVWLENEYLNQLPPERDYHFDCHTQKGKAMGRGWDHFRKEAAKLIPEVPPSEYEDRAYQLWEAAEKDGFFSSKGATVKKNQMTIPTDSSKPHSWNDDQLGVQLF